MTRAQDTYLQPNFAHLETMTDTRGLFEHALHGAPLPERGYRLDDNARALVVVTSQREQTRQLRRLSKRYLNFVLAGVYVDGTCHNRMSTGGDWLDTPSTGDSWGRTLWGLGVAAAQAGTPALRARALSGFRITAQRRSPHTPAMAFAALGATRLLRARPDENAARDLVEDCAVVLDGLERNLDWIWPESQPEYANAVVAEALVLVGRALGLRSMQDRGFQLLGFLLDEQTPDGHLYVTPARGRDPASPQPALDQQPIEVASLAAACAAAFRATREPRWAHGVAMAWAWFEGDNDTGTPMFDTATGGGYDGLEADGCNWNQSAESTLAMLATGQHMHGLCATT